MKYLITVILCLFPSVLFAGDCTGCHEETPQRSTRGWRFVTTIDNEYDHRIFVYQICSNGQLFTVVKTTRDDYRAGEGIAVTPNLYGNSSGPVPCNF